MGRRSRQPAYSSGGAVTPPFSPLDEPGSIIWLKGDTSGSFTMSGANILTWVDQSAGGANTFSASTGNATKDPVGINGIQAVSFGGAAALTKASFSAPSAADVFVVRRNIATGAQQGLWTFGSNATGDALPAPDTITYDNFGRNAFRTTVTLPVVETTAHVYNVSVAASLWIQRQNGVTTNISSLDAVSFATNVFIGQAAGGLKYTGKIGEFLVYDHVLTDARRALVLNYLRTKWGV